MVLNVEVSVFWSVNSAWVGLYNKCSNMHGATLMISLRVHTLYQLLKGSSSGMRIFLYRWLLWSPKENIFQSFAGLQAVGILMNAWRQLFTAWHQLPIVCGCAGGVLCITPPLYYVILVRIFCIFKFHSGYYQLNCFFFLSYTFL